MREILCENDLNRWFLIKCCSWFGGRLVGFCVWIKWCEYDGNRTISGHHSITSIKSCVYNKQKKYHILARYVLSVQVKMTNVCKPFPPVLISQRYWLHQLPHPLDDSIDKLCGWFFQAKDRCSFGLVRWNRRYSFIIPLTFFNYDRCTKFIIASANQTIARDFCK